MEAVHTLVNGARVGGVDAFFENERLAPLIDTLDFTAATGLDYDAIEKSVIVMDDPLADTDAFLRSCETYGALVVDTIVTSPMSGDPVAWTTELVDAVLPVE